MPAIRHAVFIAAIAVAMSALLTTLSACAASRPGSRQAARHVRIVNASYDSITALAFAPAQHPIFQDKVFNPPLQGGLTSITVEVPAGECMRDVRVTFLDGRASTYLDVDVCRYDELRLTGRRSSSDESGD